MMNPPLYSFNLFKKEEYICMKRNDTPQRRCFCSAFFFFLFFVFFYRYCT